MKHRSFLLAAGTALALAACGPDSANVDTSADLILTNARVYTLDWAEPGRNGEPADGAPASENGWHPDAQAVATRDGDIVFVGSTQDADR